MRRLLPVLLLLVVLTVAAHAAVRDLVMPVAPAVPQDQGFAEFLRTHRALFDPARPQYESGVVLVRTRAGVPTPSPQARTLGLRHADAELARVGAYRITHAFMPPPVTAAWTMSPAGGIDLSRTYCVQYLATDDAVDVAERIALDPGVEYAEPSPIRYECFIPNDYLDQDPNGTQYQIGRMKVDQAWDLPVARDATNVLLAIIDSGVDIDHEDLTGNVWDNPGSDAATYPHGIDLVGSVSDQQAASGIFSPDGDPRPGSEHGTHVSGCADARDNNGRGMCGTAYNVPFMAIKCGTDNPNAEAIYRGYTGIQWAADRGATVINCSWGGMGISQTEQMAVDYAIKGRNATVVAAAGNFHNNNDRTPFGPACLRGVLSVGATQMIPNVARDTIALFSHYGASVRCWAPGVNIYSTLPGNQYGDLSGTSMASPNAAGVVAIVRKVFPYLTGEQAAEQVHVHSTLPIQFNRQLYYGLIDAVQCVLDSATPGIVVAAAQGSGGSDTIQLQVRLRNLLAPTSSMRTVLSAVSANPNLRILDTTASYGTINTGDSAMRYFRVVLQNGATRVTQNYYLRVVDGPYIDYLVFTATVAKLGVLAWNMNTAADSLLYSVCAVSKSQAWAAGGGPTTHQGEVYSTMDGVTWSEVVSPGVSTGSGAAFYSVTALTGADNNPRVWVGTGNNGPATSTWVLYSVYTSSGYNWASIDVSAITPFVNTIHFFDQSNGIFTGDPKGGVWGIGTTTNGGQTWQPLATPVPATADTGWNNSGDWIGGTGWFGASTGKIFKTFDGGHTWTSYPAPFQQVQGLSFGDRSHGVAIYSGGRSGNGQVAYTADGGQTWTPVASPPGSAPVYNAVAFAKGSMKVWLAGSNTSGGTITSDFVYVSSDGGRTWSQQQMAPPPNGRTTILPVAMAIGSTGYTGSASNPNVSGWIAGTTIDDYQDNVTLGVASPAVVPAAGALTCVPSPVTDRALITIAAGARVERVRVYDCAGREVADLSGGLVDAGSGTVSVTFDARALPAGAYRVMARLQGGAVVSRMIVRLRP